MVLRDDVSAVAYHVYYTMLPVDLPDGNRVEAAMYGPLRDASGTLVRLPLGVDVASLPLEAGKYRLVPVDAHDRKAETAEAIEVVVPATDTNLDPRMLVLEVLKRAVARLMSTDDLRNLAHDPFTPDLRMLLRAHAQYSLEATGRFAAVMNARTPEEREHALERAADEIVATLVQVVLHGGRVPGDRSMPLTRAAIAALVKEPLRCSLDTIRSATRRLDYEDAVARMLARIRLGVPFPAEELDEILPGIGSPLLLFAVLSLASGDRAGAALTSVRAHVFPAGTIDNSGRACLLFAAWHLGDRDAVRPEVVVLARRVARGSLEEEARALLCLVAEQVADPGLTAIIDRNGRASDEACRSAAAFAEHMMRASIDEVISTLAAGDAAEPRSACAELTTETVWKVSLHELRDRPLPDTPELLPVMTYRFARSDHWWQAIVTAGHASTLGVQPYADKCHGTLAEHAIQAGFVDLAAKHAARLEDRRWISPGAKIAIAMALGEPEYLHLLAKHAGDLLDPESAEMFALALLGAVPPLGLFVARGCIEPERENANRIVEAVERVRDVAGLPPFDRAWHLRERLRSGGPQESERRLAEIARLHDELASADARLLAALRGTAAAQAALETLRIDHQRLLDQPIEPRERRAMRERIDQLEGMIRDSNEERAALRRRLAARDLATRAAPTNVAAELPTEEADTGEAIPAPIRRALIPESSRAFRDAMESVPPHVAAEAMRTLGQLAAGDVGAWQCVKQAKDTATPIYFARIGIHHRLVFQIDDRTLHVLEFVTREALLSTLKRLRGSRRSRGRVE